ncbi:MAG TPA: patatin-like phospholipase family protein [Mycobacteriales bacterium]|nr:patatin-like phospholipase family protein [Mycobacteriales bacterium]
MIGPPATDPVRRGLVLGAGGVLGFAWMVGALAALEAEEGFDARDVEVCVGTSAGSIVAALLGSGVGAEAMLRHQQGIPLPGDLEIGWDHDRDSGGALPPRPRLGVGSPDLLRRVARHPTQVRPLAALSAVLPLGRGTLAPVRRMVDRVSAGLPPGAGRPAWPDRPQVWVVAMDYAGGQRVVFGQDGAPPARLADAVTASCAIPGWYEPTVIAGRPYVDGGTVSPTSLDLLAGSGLDEAYVLAPMASFAYDRPRSPVARAERRLRRTVSRRVLAEATRVREAGTEVTLLGPGPEDLQAMGANLMDPRRRLAVLSTSLRTSTAALRRADRSGGRPRSTGTAGR